MVNLHAAFCVENEGDNPLDWLKNSIPGEPGTDYPIMAAVQQTSFGCDGLVFGGYYADPETQCQQYNVCLQVGACRKFPHNSIFLNAKNERKHSDNNMIIRIRIDKMYLYRIPLTHLPFTLFPSYFQMEQFSTNNYLIVIGGKLA